ncbi:MAG: hypothetical protein GY711_08510 [bacterium]|nr:hypothetical protein [bacterium]
MTMLSGRPLVLLPLLLALAWALLSTLVTSAPAAAQGEGRVVVLGFDGADARTTERMMDEGGLPNLAKLRGEGTFAPLVSTNPAESAAGWAALNTGLNPAQNNVPSFIRRDFYGDSPMPVTGHISIEDVPIGELEPGGILGMLSGAGLGLVIGFGVAVAVLFALLFLALLRMNKAIALPLALILGGVGAWGVQTARGYVPSVVPGVYKNRVSADGFWAHAAQAGVESVVLDAALAFDRPTTPGARVLGGLGIPDVRGGISGEWFIYSTFDMNMGRVPRGESAGSTRAGTVFRVDERKGKIESELYGPVNFWERDQAQKEWDALEKQLENTDLGWEKTGRLRDEQEEVGKRLAEFGVPVPGIEPNAALHKHRTSMPFSVEKKDGVARITVGESVHELREGEWSGWIQLTFDVNPLIQVHAVTRARLISYDDPFELYFNSFEIDPADPVFWQPVSQPNGFARELTEWLGRPFETLGWSCMTNQMKDKALDVDIFLEDIEFTLKWREELTLAALARDDWRLLFSVFSTTDRVQHMMYRYHDPEHPRHDAEEAERVVTFFGQETKLKDVIPAIYRQMDRVVGEVAAKLGPNDTLLLCADHGFTSYRRGMEVNNWLAEKGYLRLREGLVSKKQKSLSSVVDWENTQAYSLGLGMVFLNLEGREPNGIVKKSEAKDVLRRIAADFVAATDPGPEDAPFATPARVGHDAVIMPDLYPSDDWGTIDYECADLMLGFAEHYRASWGSVTGYLRLATDEDGEVVLGETYRDNGNNWSGDHASNSPEVVTGIFFANRSVALPADGVSVLHMAPTVLSLLGVTPPGEFDREPLTVR